ncbi:hypothetical protein SCUCBS95973_008376 [Sporothrix curviconia]|uniref:Uncharacterized protein n=1 Tax=Sporothrix curviconia TaxID=1260050 RepID=A0ABP0CNY6_9PEZI
MGEYDLAALVVEILGTAAAIGTLAVAVASCRRGRSCPQDVELQPVSVGHGAGSRNADHGSGDGNTGPSSGDGNAGRSSGDGNVGPVTANVGPVTANVGPTAGPDPGPSTPADASSSAQRQ